jgi:hypothetical protein
MDPFEPDAEPSETRCPNALGWAFLNLSTGAVVPARCRRNSCEFCIQGNARRRARAIAFSQPERAILLTQVGDDWQTVRARANRFKYAVQQATGKPLEWVYSVEPNPAGTGHHLHAWQRGTFLSQRMLSDLADAAGMGAFVRINRVRSTAGAGQYGLKGLGYGMKGVEATESRVAYLLANGRRLTHQSRGFFLGADGRPAPVRAAESAASAGQDSGPWQLIAE